MNVFIALLDDAHVFRGAPTSDSMRHRGPLPRACLVHSPEYAVLGSHRPSSRYASLAAVSHDQLMDAGALDLDDEEARQTVRP